MSRPKPSFPWLFALLACWMCSPVTAAPRRGPRQEPATPAPSVEAGSATESPVASPSSATKPAPAPAPDPPTAPEGGAPEARPNAPPEATPAAPAEKAEDVAALQQDLSELRDAIFKARARASIVASKLFHSKITLQVRSNVERFYEVTDFTVTVDGAPVVALERGMGPPRTPLFEVHAAPGAHELGITAHLVARRDPTYKITLHQTFGIVVPETSTVFTRLVIRETGNMWRFAKHQRGHYRLRVDLRVRAKRDRAQKRSRRVPKASKP